MGMHRFKIGIAVAVLGAITVTGCTISPPQPPKPAQTTTETTRPTAPQSHASFDPPSSFDLTNAVHLKPVDGVTQGTLDGRMFYTVDYTGTIWGVDVSTADPVLNAWFPGYDTGGGNPWACYQLVTDQSRVYTIGANYDEDPGIPVAVRLVAVDKADSTVLWDYTPQTSTLPDKTECATANVQYAITVTDAGLLLTMQQLADGAWTPTSVMLDPETGDVVWSVNASVSATSGAAFGIAVTQVPESGGAQHQVSPVNLATGAIGAPLVASPDDLPLIATGFTLAGQDGGNLVVVVAQTAPAAGTTASDTSILQVAGGTGALVPGSIVRADGADLNACRLAQAGALVCTSLSDATQAIGVSLTDGKTLWQRSIAGPSPEPSLPLLFDGYLYGVDETGTSFVLDTATGQVAGSGQYPLPIAVNDSGIVFSVPDATTISGHRCLWAPASA